MTLYELRKLFHGAGEFFGTNLAPSAAGGYLALLPWIDRPGRSASRLRHRAGGPRLRRRDRPRRARRGATTRTTPCSSSSARRPDLRAAAAVKLAMKGVPPEGALAMVRTDPELRGRDLFDQALRELPRPGRPGRSGEGDGHEARRLGHDPVDRGDDPRSGRARVLRARAVQGRHAERRHPPEGQAGGRAVDADDQERRRARRRRRVPRVARGRAGRSAPRTSTRRCARWARRSSRIGARAATSTRGRRRRGHRRGARARALRVDRVDARAGGQPRDGRDVPQEGARRGHEEAHAALRQGPVACRRRARRPVDTRPRAGTAAARDAPELRGRGAGRTLGA